MIIAGETHRAWYGILASIFLGMTFIVAGSGKLFSGVVEFQLLTSNTWLISGELAVGILLVVGILVRPIAIFSLLLTAGFIINNILLITSGLGGEPCNCFGMGQELTVIGSLWLDGIMVALAVTVLIYYPGRFFQVRPWFWEK